MKKSSYLIGLFLVLLMSFSCSKKSTDVTPTYTANLTFDGKTTSLKTPSAATVVGLVTIQAGDTKNGYTILLTKSDIKIGKTYDLKNAIGFFTLLYDGTAYLTTAGTLEITNFKDNSIVEGKFTADASPVTKTTTNKVSGVFSAKISL